MAPGTRQRGKAALLHMPVEIIAAILLEWAMLEWFAPAIARRICRHLKEITDASPRIWSKLCLLSVSRARPDDVREWLKRAKSVPKEIVIGTHNIHVALAALEGTKDAQSLIYRVPRFEDIPPYQEELILLRIKMPQLRHLVLNNSESYYDSSSGKTFRSYNPFDGALFPCLTILELFFVNLSDVQIIPGLLPPIRRLVLHGVCGPILDVIQACSGTIEDLKFSCITTYERQSYPHGRICLPNLKVLSVEAARGIVSNLEAPTLRLINADLADFNGNTRPFSSVVEWATRQFFTSTPMDITDHLTNMPKLQHLMISQHMETLKLCFASLRDHRRMCPDLQSIEVVDFGYNPPHYKLDAHFKESLKACMAWRAEEVPGFTLQFVEDIVQRTRLEQCKTVGLFIVMRHYLSHHAF